MPLGKHYQLQRQPAADAGTTKGSWQCGHWGAVSTRLRHWPHRWNGWSRFCWPEGRADLALRLLANDQLCESRAGIELIQITPSGRRLLAARREELWLGVKTSTTCFPHRRTAGQRPADA